MKDDSATAIGRFCAQEFCRRAREKLSDTMERMAGRLEDAGATPDQVKEILALFEAEHEADIQGHARSLMAFAVRDMQALH
jgi:hypothetical protein